MYPAHKQLCVFSHIIKEKYEYLMEGAEETSPTQAGTDLHGDPLSLECFSPCEQRSACALNPEPCPSTIKTSEMIQGIKNNPSPMTINHFLVVNVIKYLPRSVTVQ